MNSRTVKRGNRHSHRKTGTSISRARLGDTQPMAPVNPVKMRGGASGYSAGRTIPHSAGTTENRQGYGSRAYVRHQQSMEQRRQVLRTEQRPSSGSGKRRRTRDAGVGASIRKRQSRGKQGTLYFDYDLLLVIIFLMCFGLVMLYSTSAYSAQTDFGNDMYYFSRQALIGAIGFFVMYVVSRIDYHVYGAYAPELFIISMFLMALVKTPLGKEVNGARRWIKMPFNLTLQPAEITKIAVILFISYEICRLGRKAKPKKGILYILMLGIIAAGGILLLTDNLSTAIIAMGITCILIFVSHPKMKPFIKAAAAGIAFVAAAIGILLASGITHSQNFRLRRIISWLDPEGTADSGSYQVMQGLYAIGSGGFFGKGLGNSTQKLTAIPEAQNDMILAVICEELGVFGVIVILVLFGFMLYRLMFIAKNAPDLYGSLVATGIFAHIALQVTLNIAVVTGMVPTTGITLPFISYGGTAIVFLLAEMGIALGISSRIKLKD